MNREPAVELAVNVVDVVVENVPTQSVPQLMPFGADGLEVTVPKPEPARMTVNALGIKGRLSSVSITPSLSSSVSTRFPTPSPSVSRSNVAVAVVVPLIVNVQVELVPVQAPLHPVNADPGAGVAVNVTGVPSGYNAVQVIPQLIPAGDDVAVPVPFPVVVAVKAYSVANVAVVDVAEVDMVIRQVGLVPVQAPFHPINTMPGA